jgi:hypothetical protein
MWVAASGVHRTGRDADWRAKALVGVAGASIAGAVAGAVVALLGLAAPSSRSIVVTVGAFLLAVLPVARVPLPQRDAETPQSLLSRGPIAWSALNGGLLGLALTNRLGFWLWYMIPLTAFASASPIVGGGIWAFYGAVRMGVVAVIARRMRGSGEVHHITARLVGAGKWLRPRLTIAGVGLALIVAGWAGL